MMLKDLLFCLILLITPITGVCSKKPTNVNVKTKEMVALLCPLHTEADPKGSNLTWIHHGAQATVLSGMSPGEQKLRGVLVHGRSLVILNATVNHRGNYSCSAGKTSGQSWFSLTLDVPQTYGHTCYESFSCTLKCPNDKIPEENIPGLNISNITWHKVGDRSPTSNYFENVKKENGGGYTCTRHYRFHGQLYNMTFTVQLDVQPNKKSTRFKAILSPRKNETFHVHLGSPLVVHCKAVLYSNESELFWLIGDNFVDTNKSFPVFYNSTREPKSEGFEMTASLVIRIVSEADLLQNYICKLETDGNVDFVSIRLDKKPSPPPPCYISLALSIVCVVLFLAFVVIVYAKFKVPVVLFLRDTLGCHRSSSGGKSYDAFMMYYQSDADTGLTEPDRRFLESVLEERFGYSLCLCHRDVLPGNAVADSVLDCVEQSRAVVLIPTSSDSCLESGLLIAIHAALVERRTRLVFIQTDAEQRPCRGSVPEALQLLAEAGDRVTWKGSGSMSLSSSFWKRLRYYLTAPRDVKKTTSDKSGCHVRNKKTYGEP